MRFGKDFLWGVATASYQIEGAWNEDGKGENIWDRFSHTDGHVIYSQTGDVACDHYHRYKEDVALLKELGVKAYRFSSSWARVFPKGFGEVNQKGVEFYNNLINELIANQIEPVVTIYHWDLPQALQDIGGWANQNVIDYYVEFAEFLVKQYGDRVKKWITFNEPLCIAFLGHMWGIHAPGIKDENLSYKVVHNLMISHFRAVKKMRMINNNISIGITLNFAPVYSEAERLGIVCQKEKEVIELSHQFENCIFLDAVMKASYPEKLYNRLIDIGIISKEDYQRWLNELKDEFEPMDFLGINYYTRSVRSYGPHAHGIIPARYRHPEGEYTEMGWEVYPQGLYDLLKWISGMYPDLPLYITENGAAFRDIVTADKKVHDEKRIDYLKRHFSVAKKLIDEGVKLKGYFVWSFIDNFEWAEGYTKRFGLVYVDYETQERIKKDSFYFYKEYIENN